MTRQEWIAQLEFLAKTSKDLSGDLLCAFGDLLVRAQFSYSYSHPSFMGNPFGPEILAEIREAQLRRELREHARYLRRRKLLKYQEEGGKIIAKITKEGEARAIEHSICGTEDSLPDGEYTVVAFDIPEDTKITRKYLRARLRSFGFEPHQLSVWISQKDVAEKVSEYVHAVGAHRWVSVFRGRLLK